MALEFSFVLLERYAPIALESAVDIFQSSHSILEVKPGVWRVDLRDTAGFILDQLTGHDGYFETATDSGMHSWSPSQYVDVGFRFDKSFPYEGACRNMLGVVTKILENVTNDALLTMNDDHLVFLRVQGACEAQHASGFWESFGEQERRGILRGLGCK